MSEFDTNRNGRVLTIDINYPRNDDQRINTIEVGLCDVRAADTVRITYDFERDGWSIQQASKFVFTIEDKVMDADWQEVAFVQAWGRQKDEGYERGNIL